MKFVMVVETILHLPQKEVISSSIWHKLFVKNEAFVFYTKMKASFWETQMASYSTAYFLTSQMLQDNTIERAKFPYKRLKCNMWRKHSIFSAYCTWINMFRINFNFLFVMVADNILLLQHKICFRSVIWHHCFRKNESSTSYTRSEAFIFIKNDGIIWYCTFSHLRDITECDCSEAPVHSYCWYDWSTWEKCCFIWGMCWTMSLPSVLWKLLTKKISVLCAEILPLFSEQNTKSFHPRCSQTIYVT